MTNDSTITNITTDIIGHNTQQLQIHRFSKTNPVTTKCTKQLHATTCATDPQNAKHNSGLLSNRPFRKTFRKNSRSKNDTCMTFQNNFVFTKMKNPKKTFKMRIIISNLRF